MRRWVVTVVLCVSIFLLLSLFKFNQITSAIAFAESFPEHSETVEIAVAKAATYVEHIDVLGEVRAPNVVALRNEYAGVISSVGLSSGAHVSAGQVLIALDITTEKAELKALRAQLALAKSSYKRAVTLSESNVLSAALYDQALAEKQAIEAQIESLESVIQKKKVIAPFGGVVGIQDFEVGQYLAANTEITTLVGDHDFVWVDFSVAQFYPALEIGTAVKIKLLGDKNQMGTEGQPSILTGEVVAKNAQLEKSTRSMRYRAKVSIVGKRISAQSIVNVFVPVNKSIDVLSLPVQAVQYDQGGAYIYLLASEGNGRFRAQRRPVNVVQRINQDMLIENTIEPGSQVAAAGAFKLYPGILVYGGERRISDSGSPATATAPVAEEKVSGS